jgi:NAD(P)-dependent dehydrogenase (short-subunit alcohol dehydrogenase family)
MVENIATDGHKINCLVVNAAIAKPLPFEAVTESNFDLTMNVNFKGAFFTLQKSLSLLASSATVVIYARIRPR